MDRYIDTAFVGVTPGTRAAWAAATPARLPVVTGTDGFATVAAALAGAAAGDVLWIAPGSYALPGAVTVGGLTFRGVGTPTLTAAARVALPAGETRFKGLAFTASPVLAADYFALPAGGKAGFVACSVAGAAYLALVDGADAGAAFAGCVLHGLTCRTLNGGGWGDFPGPFAPAGGPQGRNPGAYRHRLAVEAPASFQLASQQKRVVWVPLDVIRAEVLPVRGREFEEARVQVAECTHLVRTRGGAVGTETMRLRDADTGAVYQITAVLAFDGAENRTEFACVRGSP